MSVPTQPLRDEHARLLPYIERLRSAADSVGRVPPAQIHATLSDLRTFLLDHLIPHAEAEDRVLYPAVARAMGAAQATSTMSRDHAAVGRMARELAELSEGAGRDGLTAERETELRRVLYGLHALVTVHFAKEEAIYLPLLDRVLSAEEVARLYAEMERHG